MPRSSSPILLAFALLAACDGTGSPERSAGASRPEEVPSQLVLTDGSHDAVALPAPVAGCIESETRPGTRVFYVAAGRPGSGADAFYLEVPEDELNVPLSIALPWEVVLADGSSFQDHVVFAATKGGSTTRGNEASGSEEGSSGTVEVLAAGCEVGAEVRIRIDAHLGSELEGSEPIDVAGGVSTEAVDLDTFFGAPDSEPSSQDD